MKLLLSLLFLTTAFSSYAMTREEADGLLRSRNLSLTALEARGWKLMPGERTGHGRSVAFRNVQVLFTSSQVILRNEVDAVSFNGPEVLSSMESLRFNGQYVMKEDVLGTMIQDR